MLRHASTILGLACLVLCLPGSAYANLQLSFDKVSYSALAGGPPTPVMVLLTQVPGGIQVGPGDGLISTGIALSFNTPAGVAAVLSPGDITPGPSFTLTSSKGVTPMQATLAWNSLSPLGITDLSHPLLLGTFLLSGLSVNKTQISLDQITPGFSFATSQGQFLSVNTASASVTVLPEPSSFSIVLSGVSLLLGAWALRPWRSLRSSTS
jgi:hypothetical protein